MTPIDLSAKPALAPGVRLQTDHTTGEPVLLWPEGVTNLNDTAAAIVALCDGARPVQEIVAALAREYDAPAEALREDVIAALAELQEAKLIVLT